MSELPDWYVRRFLLRALQGEPAVELPPDDPDSNVVAIELLRTNRAIRMMREAAIRQRPL